VHFQHLKLPEITMVGMEKSGRNCLNGNLLDTAIEWLLMAEQHDD